MISSASSWASALADGQLQTGADDGIRTRDPNLGKVVLYQLSHVRSAPQTSKARAEQNPSPTRCDPCAQPVGTCSAAFFSSARASFTWWAMFQTRGTASLPTTMPKYMEPM